MDHGLKIDAAKWAIETWAIALGIITDYSNPVNINDRTSAGKARMVGIAWRTCSGKDETAQLIGSVNKRVIHINTDIYFKTRHDHFCNGYNCFEHEQAMRMEDLYIALFTLKNRGSVLIKDRNPGGAVTIAKLPKVISMTIP